MSTSTETQPRCKTCKGTLASMKSAARFCSDSCRSVAHRKKARRQKLRARTKHLQRLQARWIAYLEADREHRKNKARLEEYLSDPGNPFNRVRDPEWAKADIRREAGTLRGRLRLLEGDIIRSGFKADEVKKSV